MLFFFYCTQINSFWPLRIELGYNQEITKKEKEKLRNILPNRFVTHPIYVTRTHKESHCFKSCKWQSSPTTFCFSLFLLQWVCLSGLALLYIWSLKKHGTIWIICFLLWISALNIYISGEKMWLSIAMEISRYKNLFLKLHKSSKISRYKSKLQKLFILTILYW